MSEHDDCNRAGRAGFLLLVVLIFAISFPANALHAASLTAQQRHDVLNEAQQAYDRGISVLRSNPVEAKAAFQSAVQRFEIVVNDGVMNGVLYYNLANAYLQSGDVARAILNYRRAEQLIPGDARLQSNLAYARSLCSSRIAPSGEKALAQALLGWHRSIPLHWRFTWFLLCYVLFWIVLGLRIFWLGRGATIASWCLAILWLALGTSVAADVMGWGRRPAGVIVADNTIVRKGYGLGFEPQFEQPLSSGVEFEQLERQGDWINIELPDGKSGWVEAKAAEMVEKR